MTAIHLKPINQQVVAVVGASSGIGRATALQFAQQGAKVAVSARSVTGLNSLVEEIKALGGDAIAIPADVADFDQVKAIADKTVEYFGRLDTWVHAAATAVFARFENHTPEEFRRVIEVNLMGQVYGAMVALPYLRREGRGAFIAIGSVEGHRSLPLQSAYSCSKHAVEGFLDSLRVELIHDQVPISITNIMPSTINTPFYNNGLTKLGRKPKGVPPFYQPELVARSILHAAENPVRDLIVGDSGRVLDVAQKFVPGLIDAALALIAVPGEHSVEPKAESAPNNLYAPVEGDNRVRGDFDNQVFPSFLDWFDWHPTAKWGTVAAGLAGLALLAAQTLGDNKSA
ncbi:MAG TPA: SDR family oxidoreductase [Leptolyngbyaceae cyanobacterium]